MSDDEEACRARDSTTDRPRGTRRALHRLRRLGDAGPVRGRRRRAHGGAQLRRRVRRVASRTIQRVRARCHRPAARPAVQRHRQDRSRHAPSTRWPSTRPEASRTTSSSGGSETTTTGCCPTVSTSTRSSTVSSAAAPDGVDVELSRGATPCCSPSKVRRRRGSSRAVIGEVPGRFRVITGEYRGRPYLGGRNRLHRRARGRDRGPAPSRVGAVAAHSWRPGRCPADSGPVTRFVSRWDIPCGVRT